MFAMPLKFELLEVFMLRHLWIKETADVNREERREQQQQQQQQQQQHNFKKIFHSTSPI